MERKSVTSSNINSIGFDNGTMQVEFSGGAVYDHFDVPQDEYQKFMTSESKGSHYHHAIKGKYRVQRLDTK